MRRVISYYEYITQEGDTFDLLALDMYNDERLAHYIRSEERRVGKECM